MSKPLFKYVGGKTWLKDSLRYNIGDILAFNQDIKSYCEPFAGGLGSFLSVYDVLNENGVDKIYINDINKTIIEVYQNIYEGDTQEMFDTLDILLKRMKAVLPSTETKDKTLLEPANKVFKEIRSEFNDPNTSNKASYLIFLQYHSFNGIYRENSKGLYNTPFNWNWRPVSLDSIMSRADSISDIFDDFDITFSSHDYSKMFDIKDCLYYCDPPYANDEGLENAYSKGGFGFDEQTKLISLLKDKKYLYSNHDLDVLSSLFDTESEKITVSRKNRVSSGDRTNDKKEMLIKRK